MNVLRFKPLLIMAAVLLMPGPGLLANEEKAGLPAAKGEITGAGSHFSWFIMNAVKPGLEKKFDRKIKLYGRESMLGVGCNAGIKMAKQSAPDRETFGLVCCKLSKKEIKEKGLTVHPLATEPVLILVNKNNPVRNLSKKQVKAIFRGDIKSWIEVGGPDKPIVVVTRLHCKKRPGHWKTILPSKDLFRKDRLNVKSAGQMVSRIKDFPGAIGHTGSAWDFSESDNVVSISIDGVKPTGQALARKAYPFYRQLSIVTHGKVSSDLSKIIKDVQTGPDLKKVAKRYNLLPKN